MKPLLTIATFCFALWLTSLDAQDLRVSQHDRDDIRAAIRAVTREPILGLTPVYEPDRVPGSIPVQMSRDDGRNGKVHLTPITEYERTDMVSVMTGSHSNLTGGSYAVRKVGGKWKVVNKRFWIH